MLKISKLVFLHALSLLAGFMAIVQWSLVPAQNRLSATGYATLEQGMNNVLKTLTPTLMIISLVFGIMVIVLAFRQKSTVRYNFLIAVLSLVVMIVSTLIINAPVNDAVDMWNSAAPPADWQILRDRWEFGHALRFYIGLFGLFFLQIGIIWNKE